MARREIGIARAAAELTGTKWIALAIALHEGTPLELPAGLEAGTLEHQVALRLGKPLPGDVMLVAEPPECEPRLRAALATASAGDGGPLASVFETCDPNLSSWEYLIGVLPRVTKNRERLAAALRMSRDHFRPNIPFDFLDDVVMQRDIARLAGDHEDASRWQQIFERHAKVLGDRQKLIALLCWIEP